LLKVTENGASAHLVESKDVVAVNQHEEFRNCNFGISERKWILEEKRDEGMAVLCTILAEA
jgi:hypothetical protein